MKERGERRGRGGDYPSEHSSVHGTKLADLGVTKNQTHDWKKKPVLDNAGGREKVGNPTGRVSTITAGLPLVEDALPYKRKARFSNHACVITVSDGCPQKSASGSRRMSLPPNSRLPIGPSLALAVCGFLSLGAAYAGTCVNRQDGTDTVQSCDNGSYTVTDRHGRRWVYGTPNAGFEHYPGQGLGGERACPLNSSWRASSLI
jgi:hypothetical protein